jgi:hypothetical protein
MIADVLGRRVWMPSVGRVPAMIASKTIGIAMGDIVITDEEYVGLTRGLLGSSGPVTGATRLPDWLKAHRDEIGTTYRSELRRHFR